MGKRTVIPFGPQHPVLPEPVHLDLVLEDEKVVEAIPSIGFVHRGLEKLVEVREYPEMVFVSERICGICSFGHGWGYSHAVEGLMGIEVPERAEWIRTIWHELSRLHSHLLWLGLLADGFGFESLFMQCWKLREKILDIFEDTTGGRVIFSVCRVGGVIKDIENEKLEEIVKTLQDMRGDIENITNVFTEDSSVRNRLVGVGVLSKEDAYALGAVGPTARGSGVASDQRSNGPGKYKELGFEPIVEEAGDCYARCQVRIREVFQSIDLIAKAVEMMPKEGEVLVPVKGMLPEKSNFIARVEQPRGEAIYYVKSDKATRFLSRFRVRTPTCANIPAMVKMLGGADLADVPMIVLTIDPCISCTER